MRSGVLASTLLCVALGVALGLTSSRTRFWAVLVLVTAALGSQVALSNAGMRPGWADALFLACWINVAGPSAAAYLPRPVGTFAALLFSLDVGLLCGALNALTGSLVGVLQALPGVLVLWPVMWAAHRQWTVAVKVVSSWLAAVALLAATLQFLPVTPGYLPDHLE